MAVVLPCKRRWTGDEPGHKVAGSECLRAHVSGGSAYRELLVDCTNAAGVWTHRLSLVPIKEQADGTHTDVTAVAAAAAANALVDRTDALHHGTYERVRVAFARRPSVDQLRLARRKRRWQPTPGAGTSRARAM